MTAVYYSVRYVESEIFASLNKTNRQTLNIFRDYSFMSVLVTQYKNTLQHSVRFCYVKRFVTLLMATRFREKPTYRLCFLESAAG